MTQKHNPQAGFSLVELAVALVVIGILLAGVLKGQELIESARLKRLISQINAYRLATTTFMDRYEALPGDFSRASVVIDSSLVDGGGSGRLSGGGLQAGSSALSFWAHLVLSDLTPPPGKLEALGVPEFGKGAPTTSLGGGVTVEHNPDPSLSGLWFVVGNAHHNASKAALFTPRQVLRVLSQVDSTTPLAGHVQARDGVDVPTHSCVTSHGELNISYDQPACVLYFRF